MFPSGEGREHPHAVGAVLWFSHNLVIERHHRVRPDDGKALCRLFEPQLPRHRLGLDFGKVHDHFLRLQASGDNFFDVADADIEVADDARKQFFASWRL